MVALIAPMPSSCWISCSSRDIMMSVIVLMVAMYITRPVDFNVFPTTLLMLTLFRLALNVSSSRLILLNGHTGTSAAGDVIQAFGNFVVGGNYIIGAVIFLVLIAIQYVVINHGAVRISEVTARFTLDALPGKQMSIDSDLNSGLIDEAEARRRRKQLASEAEFFGAMDGASRFTQRDAVAGVLITGINIVAGLLIGVLQHGVDVMQGAPDIHRSDHRRRPGDGDSGADDLDLRRHDHHPRQLGKPAGRRDPEADLRHRRSRCCWRAAFWLRWPRSPDCPRFRSCCSGCGLGNHRVADEKARPRQQCRRPRRSRGQSPERKPRRPAARRAAVDRSRRGPCFVHRRRREFSAAAPHRWHSETAGHRTGVHHSRGSRHRQSGAARARILISLKGVEIARFELPRACELAIAMTATERPPDGRATKDPAFGVPAWWVPSSQAESVRDMGYTVIDPLSVMSTHLTELVKRFAHELFSRQEARKLLDRVSAENAKVVEDLVPKLLPLATVQRVIQNLLRERVSIRDAVSILEALGEAAPSTRNPVLLTDYVRQSRSGGSSLSRI